MSLRDVLVSVPFRGSCSEMFDCISFCDRLCISFRPLSGFMFWNEKYVAVEVELDYVFPSPFGVHVLKFPRQGERKVKNGKKFPSPFGVHVLKFAPVSWLVERLPCFRPLSGFMFWNCRLRTLAPLSRWSFRPLSGFMFWNELHFTPCKCIAW